MTIAVLLLVLAAVCFGLAGFNVPRETKIRFEWVAFMFLTVAAIAGKTVLIG